MHMPEGTSMHNRRLQVRQLRQGQPAPLTGITNEHKLPHILFDTTPVEELV
jgi:hypothetical protein